MTKRFEIIQNGDLFTVRDTVENKPMGVFEFKGNEFPSYFCFHKIIDLMNDLSRENEQLKQALKELKEDNKRLRKCIKEDKSCGHCKHLQIDGMFGMWCHKGRNWQNTDANYCPDYER